MAGHSLVDSNKTRGIRGSHEVAVEVVSYSLACVRVHMCVEAGRASEQRVHAEKGTANCAKISQFCDETDETRE